MTAVAGVDTWSPCWYLDTESAQAKALTAMATRSLGAGRGKLLPKPIAGHRIGWFPTSGMLYAEGHPDPDGLGDPNELAGRLGLLEDAMREEGVPVPTEVVRYPRAAHGRYGDAYEGPAGIRRLDSTVNLSASSSSAGLAILSGIGAVVRDMPRVQPEVWWSVDGRRVETVYMRGYSGERVLGRAYDKGVEAMAAGPGELVRLEDQRRFTRDSRRDVVELTRGYVRSKFHRRFEALWRSSKGVTVGSVKVLAGKLAELVEEYELSYTQARNLAGDLLMQHAEVSKGRGPSSRTKRRRAATRRDLGLVLGDGLLDEVEIDLHGVLTEAMDTAGWMAQG